MSDRAALRRYFDDVLMAARRAESFSSTFDADSLARDVMRLAAVERMLEIVGEALSRVFKADPALFATLRDATDAIGLRNVISHRCDNLNVARLLTTIREALPLLIDDVEAALRALDE